MRGELSVPGNLMLAYSQFDGMEIDIETDDVGFAPPVARMPISPSIYSYFQEPDPLNAFGPRELTFTLTCLRFRDNVLVYTLQEPK